MSDWVGNGYLPRARERLQHCGEGLAHTTVPPTPHSVDHNAESLAARAFGGGGEPEPFRRDLAFEPLKDTTEPRAVPGLHDGQAVGLILFPGHSAELNQRDGLGLAGGIAGGEGRLRPRWPGRGERG